MQNPFLITNDLKSVSDLPRAKWKCSRTHVVGTNHAKTFCLEPHVTHMQVWDLTWKKSAWGSEVCCLLMLWGWNFEIAPNGEKHKQVTVRKISPSNHMQPMMISKQLTNNSQVNWSLQHQRPHKASTSSDQSTEWKHNIEMSSKRKSNCRGVSVPVINFPTSHCSQAVQSTVFHLLMLNSCVTPLRCCMNMTMTTLQFGCGVASGFPNCHCSFWFFLSFNAFCLLPINHFVSSTGFSHQAALFVALTFWSFLLASTSALATLWTSHMFWDGQRPSHFYGLDDNALLDNWMSPHHSLLPTDLTLISLLANIATDRDFKHLTLMVSLFQQNQLFFPFLIGMSPMSFFKVMPCSLHSFIKACACFFVPCGIERLPTCFQLHGYIIHSLSPMPLQSGRLCHYFKTFHRPAMSWFLSCWFCLSLSSGSLGLQFRILLS